MKKTTKGAIAAAAAGVLLLGGAGTIAFWSDSSTIDGGTVDTGNLALGDSKCAGGWLYAPENASAGEPVELLVPGDTISKECTFIVSASGDNLAAILTTPDTVPITSEGADTFQATVAATYDIAGTPAKTPTTITAANEGQTVTATIIVTFPFGDVDTINANGTRDVTATLDDIEVTLVQTET